MNINMKLKTPKQVIHKRKSSYWLAIRKKCIERDKNTCRKCGCFPAKQIHHIIPFREVKKHKLNNLITLCKKCHSIADNLYFKYGLRQQDKIWLKQND